MSTKRVRVLGVALGYLVLVVGAVLYLGPFLIQVATSFKSDADAVAHPLSLIPEQVDTSSYERVATDPAVDVPLWLGNSLLVTVSVTVGRLLIDAMAGYALARLRWRGRGTVFSGVLMVMAVPPVVLLIPKFLVLRELSLFDSYAGMILPLLADAMGIFLMKQAFEQVPHEVEESAKMDGAGVVRRWWSVVLPMVRPAVVTLGILAFQASWNEFTHYLVSTSSPGYETLTVGLARLVGGALGEGQQLPLKLTIALVATVPVAVVFLISQRHLVRAQLGGAVKG
ncbi:carbohydrate ABC transporter permease [Saccharopolyspora rhizosphaerae]|uniref:Carbohydrate ABC transporter permease n=1 Tax=Saccharopolyspora rhizosphaerae TaxID=2492662 RepID=A0A3R8VJ43_9PSEU|nr:carbohydrate ABC transporter permease [Saccharopolyspora rhizosphaerae]RRO18669.1 carbohydrate ABC transporter permease [Saccharopolyspora rhizosphaerae]